MLTPEERIIVDYIHDFMAYTNNLIKDTRGYDVLNIDYQNIPQDSVILLFGGYKTIGFHAADSVKAYHNRYKKWPDLIITGKSSNKYDNTANFGSEVNVYQYILKNCDIPENVIKQYDLVPTDTSTAENTQSVEAVLAANPSLRNRSLVLFTQSYYARRAIHDFAQKLPHQQLIVANLPKADFDNGLFYHDRADGNAVDIMMGACFYQSMYNHTRWENGEALPPTQQELSVIPSKEDIKPIIQKYCGWLYPNNMVDLGITTDLTVAKNLINKRKEELFSKPEFSPQRQKTDLINAVNLYRQHHSLKIFSLD